SGPKATARTRREWTCYRPANRSMPARSSIFVEVVEAYPGGVRQGAAAVRAPGVGRPRRRHHLPELPGPKCLRAAQDVRLPLPAPPLAGEVMRRAARFRRTRAQD